MIEIGDTKVKQHIRRSGLARSVAAGLTVAGLLALGACGGGGGDGSSGSTATGTSTGGTTSGTSASTSSSASITQQNAEARTARAYQMASSLYGAGSGASSSTQSVKSVDGSAPFSAVEFALARFNDVETGKLGDFSSNSLQQAKAVGSASAACISGGSVSVSINDADNSGTLTTGDSMSITYSNCQELGFVYSGSVTVNAIVVTGTYGSAARSIGATYNYNAFTARPTTASGQAVTINGDLGIQASYQSSPQVISSATVAGNRFSVTANGELDTLSNYAATVTVNSTTSTYSYSIRGTETDGGNPAVTVTTPVAFTGTLGAFPASGSIRVSSSDDSAAQLTATSSTSVQIAIDANGDGTYETTLTRTWSQIAAD